jgi:ABC-type uncharacterized transport system substrate-binding protein
MRTTTALTLVAATLTMAFAATAGNYEDKKVLYVNSYHKGYAGSDPITQGIEQVLSDQGVELKIHYMDTKNNPEEVFAKAAALEAKALIEAFQPDVVIASDDNASKYLIMPYFKAAALPFVFCGVNWDASVYGFPYRNVTGMVEVALVSEILRHLKKYAKGDRVGFIAGDRLSERKNLEHYIKRFDLQFEQVYFAKTFAEWKGAFRRLQSEVDMIMMTNHVGIPDWDDREAKTFVERHTRIPAGSEHRWEMPLALVGVTKDFEEMGTWAAHAALKILDGVSPSQIPVTANKKGELLFNMAIANKLGIETAPPFATLFR